MGPKTLPSRPAAAAAAGSSSRQHSTANPHRSKSEKKPPSSSRALHVSIASLTLPPGVSGDVKGELVACVEALQWKFRQPPTHVQLRICWWGAAADTVVPWHASRGAGAAFPVTSGPRFLVRYLRDMGCLAVAVEECPSATNPAGRTIGTISIDTSNVDVARPLVASSVPCLGANQQVLAVADVSLRIHYSQLSSFEMAEHLASADKALPLYPLPAVANSSSSRRQTAAGGQAHAAPGALQGASTVVTGVSAAQVAPVGATGKASVDSMQRIAGAELPQAAAENPTAARPEKPQAGLEVARVGHPAAAAAGAECGRDNNHPLLEVIRKAEQLKASLDQAAQAGILLALPSMQHQALQQQQQLPQLPQAQQPYHSLLSAGGSSSICNMQPQAGELQLALTQQQQQLPPPAARTTMLDDILAAAAEPGWGVLQGAVAGQPAAGSNSLPSVMELLAVLSGAQAATPAGTAADSAAAHLQQLPALPDSHTQRDPTHHSSRHRSSTRAVAAAATEDAQQRATSLEGSDSITTSSRCSSSSSDAGSSSSSGESSLLLSELDDLEELEDLLLQELLNMRTPPAAPHPPRRTVAAAGGGGSKRSRQQQNQQAGQAAAAETPSGALQLPGSAAGASQQPAQQQESTTATSAADADAAASTPRLHVELLSLSDLPTAIPHHNQVVTAVLKCAGQRKQLDATQLVQQGVHQKSKQQQQQEEEEEDHEAGQHAAAAPVDSQPAPCSTTIAGPACLSQPLLLAAQKPCLVIEVWSGDPAPGGAAAGGGAAQLIGIVRVPLLHGQQWPPKQEGPAAAAAGPSCLSHLDDACVLGQSDAQCCVVSGRYPLYDVLQGKAAGQLGLRVSIMQGAKPSAPPAPATAPPAAPADGVVQAAGEAGVSSAAAAGAAGGVSEVLAVRHVIDVTLVSATGLPDAADLTAAQQPVPDKRFIKYSFPGDEPLYTQEVGCVSAPVFTAHARHMVVLQPGETVADCFAATSGSNNGSEPGSASAAPDHLQFEVFDKWQDDTDSLAAVGSLPLQQVLDLCQAGEPLSSSSSAGLEDHKEEAEEGQHNNSSISSKGTFMVQLVLTPPAAAETAVQQTTRSALLKLSVCYSRSCCYALDDDDADALPERATEPAKQQQVEDQQEEEEQERHHQQQQDRQHSVSACCSDPAVGAAADDVEYPRVMHVDSQQQQQHQGLHEQAVPAMPTTSIVAAAEPDGATGAAGSTAVARPPLSAELCVKVIRACGLQAAVKEAEGWLGHSSGLLGRARQLGPHPYVTVALFPGSNSAAAVRTPFQAQTFCPQFHYQQVLPLSLTPATLSALATSDASVELWHHCPRSQAVAAALSRGLSSSYATLNGQQQVFLGSGSLPLQGLLIHSQGIHCWVVLKSQLGVPVGAVQLQLNFTHIGGTPVEASPATLSPLARHPEWLQLLPAAPARRLSAFAALPPPGFEGQTVRVSLHIEELLLGGGGSSSAGGGSAAAAALERPKIATYTATCRLPGSSQQISTQAKACSSSHTASSSSLLARSWRVDWKFSSHLWAVADARLAMALLGYPLVLTVAKQEPSKKQQQQQGLAVHGKGQAPAAAAVAAVMPCGSAEVDLSPLLATRPGSSAPSCRWLSGSVPLIHPLSPKASGHNNSMMQLRFKVLLELQPSAEGLTPPSQDWLQAHPEAVWQVTSGPLATATIMLPSKTAPSAAPTAPRQGAAPASAAAAAETPADGTDGAAAQVAGHASSSSSLSQAVAMLQPDADADVNEAVTASDTQEAAAAAAAVVALQEAPQAAAASPARQGAAGSSSSKAAGGGGGGRLRGEVSHVSAPSAASSGPVSPAGAAAATGGDSGVVAVVAAHGATSPVMSAASPQSGQLMLLPADSPLQHQHQQQELGLPASVAAAAVHQMVQLCDVRVCVECALNLDLPDLPAGWLPALYVRYSWPGCTAAVSTPLVEASSGPLGGCSSSKWFHCLHLPLALQPHSHNHSLALQEHSQAALAARSSLAEPSRSSTSVVVVFQVWCRAVPEDVAAELPPLYSGLAAVPAPCDHLLGCAVLDLSALQLLGAVDGWYNILDQQQQPRGQIKVSLTPLKPLDAPPLSHSADSSMQQVMAAAWLGSSSSSSAAPPPPASSSSLSAPTTAAMLEKSLLQLQQHVEQLQSSGRQHQLELSLQQQQQDDFADLLREVLPASATDSSSSTSKQVALHAASSDGSPQPLSAAVDELSDLAFMALAAQSTATAEATAAAVEAATTSNSSLSGRLAGVEQPDSLLETLRANMEELDKLSAALAVRIGRTHPPEVLPGASSGLSNKMPSAAVEDQQQQQQQGDSSAVADAQTAAASVPPAAAAACISNSFRHVRTLSDDEEYLVAAADMTDSDDTDELMGRVDWSLAANSDDEQQEYGGGGAAAPTAAGPTSYRGPQQQPSRQHQGPSGHVLQQPLNTEDWMFDIGRSSRSSRPAAAAAAPTSAAQPSSSSSSQLPVHPGQMTPAQAGAAAAAAAARLAQVDAAAARRAADAAAAATRSRERPTAAAAAAAAGDAAGDGVQSGPAPAAAAVDTWEQLAQVEDEDEAQARHTRQQHRQRQRQQQQQFAALMMTRGPADTAASAAAASASAAAATINQQGVQQQPQQQQSQQQQQQHDPRRLPEELESRLDLLLAEFQVAASGPGALVGRCGASGPLQQFGSYSAQASAAAAFGRLEGGRGAGAWASDADSDDSGDMAVPVQRMVHQSRTDEAGQPGTTSSSSRGGGGGGGRSAAATAAAGQRDPDAGETLPRVCFANALPPVQDDFVLEFSDGPPRHHMLASRQQPQPQQPQQQPVPATTQPQPHTQQEQRQGGPASSSSTPGSTGSGRTPGVDSRTAAPTSSSTAVAAAGTSAAAAAAPAPSALSTQQRAPPAAAAAASLRPAAEAAAPPAARSSGVVISTVGRRPVGAGGGGSSSAVVDVEEMMFSISRGPSRSSSGGGGAGSRPSSGIRHPGM